MGDHLGHGARIIRSLFGSPLDLKSFWFGLGTGIGLMVTSKGKTEVCLWLVGQLMH